MKMQNEIKQAEITKYGYCIDLCANLLQHTTSVHIICADNYGKYFDINDINNFPFNLKNEVAILLADAISEYKNIINQIQQTDEQQD